MLRGSHNRVCLGQKLLQDVMGLLLAFESFSEVFASVVAESDGLVAACCLNMVFAKHESCLLEMLEVCFKRGLHVVNFLVDDAHLEVD